MGGREQWQLALLVLLQVTPEYRVLESASECLKTRVLWDILRHEQGPSPPISPNRFWCARLVVSSWYSGSDEMGAKIFFPGMGGVT